MRQVTLAYFLVFFPWYLCTPFSAIVCRYRVKRIAMTLSITECRRVCKYK